MKELNAPEPEEHPLASKFTMWFALVGVIIFSILYDELFPQSPGFNVKRILISAAVGGVLGFIGCQIGMLIERKRLNR